MSVKKWLDFDGGQTAYTVLPRWQLLIGRTSKKVLVYAGGLEGDFDAKTCNNAANGGLPSRNVLPQHEAVGQA